MNQRPPSRSVGDAPNPADNTDSRVLALEAALRRIRQKHTDTTAFWYQHREFPSDFSKHWHDGFVTGLATCSIIAGEALDGRDETWDAALGSDREWFDATGNCGHCGNMARYCVCGPDDPCGCGPHELATAPEPCHSCNGRGVMRLPAEVVAERVGGSDA